MILTTELPQELLQALREAPLRLNAMRSALLAANLEGVWWGLSSEQTFVINRTLLRQRLEEEIAWIDVGGTVPKLLDGAPPCVLDLLSLLAAHPASDPLCLLRGTGEEPAPSSLIGLAGFLLDYAAAYVVGDEGRNCLGERMLQLVEAYLITANGQRNNLLAFSYPDELASSATGSTDLTPSAVAARLETILQERFSTAQSQFRELAGFRLEVMYSTVCLDQVAL
ncbi:hypothetical protein JCM8202v2_000433 [Rhodotorula sphaerocarpa]